MAAKKKKDNRPHSTSVTQEPKQTPEQVLRYWTPERIRRAVPLPHPTPVRDPKHERGGTPEEGGNIGAPMVIHPNNAQARTLGDPAPVPNYGSWPYSAIGKLFMTFGGVNYVGTAFSVSGSSSAFMTAGHCVYDQASSQWASNAMIALSYGPGNPGAQFAAVRLVTLVGWVGNAGYQYDIGGGVVSGDMFAGRGNLGLLFNQAANTGPWSSVGYPAKTPYPGDTMYQAVGPYVGTGDAGTIGMSGNSMGGGSSGGPWVVNSNWGYVNGHNSYHYTATPSNEYSPYYGQAAYNVWACAVAGQCG